MMARLFGVVVVTLAALFAEASALVAQGNSLDDKLIITAVIVLVWGILVFLVTIE